MHRVIFFNHVNDLIYILYILNHYETNQLQKLKEFINCLPISYKINIFICICYIIFITTRKEFNEVRIYINKINKWTHMQNKLQILPSHCFDPLIEWFFCLFLGLKKKNLPKLWCNWIRTMHYLTKRKGVKERWNY